MYWWSFRSALDGDDYYSSLNYEPASDSEVCQVSDLFNATWHDIHVQNEVLEQEFVEAAMEQSMQQKIEQYSPPEAEANE